MCRYAMVLYKDHYACFACRKMFRHLPPDPQQVLRCPQCRRPMTGMGLDFKAPPHTDREAWQVLEILADHGITFYSCGCNGPGYRPRTLRELPAFLESCIPKSAGQALLERWTPKA